MADGLDVVWRHMGLGCHAVNKKGGVETLLVGEIVFVFGTPETGLKADNVTATVVCGDDRQEK